MLITFDELKTKYSQYAFAGDKIRREVESGKYTQIVRGLYETNPHADGKYLATAVYGPSYLSFDYALSAYSLIPETAFAYTSATYGKGKHKQYQTPFGTFTYKDVPEAAYPFGIRLCEENGYSFQIATPEKALCDKLYSISPVGTLHSLEELLFDDLRIDEVSFKSLNFADILQIAPLYGSTNLKLLVKYLNRRK